MMALEYRNRILEGDVRQVLATLPDECVHMVVTSPPYIGLRNYGVEGQIGLEASIEEYVGVMVEVFREVKRVLRSDGTLWLNIGDSYAASSSLSVQRVRKDGRQEGSREGDVPDLLPQSGAAALDGGAPRTSTGESGGVASGAQGAKERTSNRSAADDETKDLRGVGGEVPLLWRDGASVSNDRPRPERRSPLSGESAAPTLQSDPSRELRSSEVSDSLLELQLREGDAGPLPSSEGIKPKDLMGIPWRVALALQADGWWLRSDVIWAKPSPMPESVTDRPTSSHEHIFLLSKRPKYYYDAEAIREKVGEPTRTAASFRDGGVYTAGRSFENDGSRAKETHGDGPQQTGRNARDVWTFPSKGYAGDHYATFPPELPKRCILAGTSERGACPECGAPWRRLVEDSAEYAAFKEAETARRGGGVRSSDLDTLGLTRGTSNKSVSAEHRTVGWEPTCAHEAEPVRSLVLDPFMGAGTTALAALLAGRDFVGIELNPKYIAAAEARIAEYRNQLPEAPLPLVARETARQGAML